MCIRDRFYTLCLHSFDNCVKYCTLLKFFISSLWHNSEQKRNNSHHRKCVTAWPFKVHRKLSEIALKWHWKTSPAVHRPCFICCWSNKPGCYILCYTSYIMCVESSSSLGVTALSMFVHFARFSMLTPFAAECHQAHCLTNMQTSTEMSYSPGCESSWRLSSVLQHSVEIQLAYWIGFSVTTVSNGIIISVNKLEASQDLHGFVHHV